MKPSESEKSTFVPGGELRAHSDNQMFNSVGTAKVKPITHAKTHPIKQMGGGYKASY